MSGKLKLYVWENVLRDCTAGLAVALAHDSESARALIIEKLGYTHEDFSRPPEVVTTASAFVVHGGG